MRFIFLLFFFVANSLFASSLHISDATLNKSLREHIHFHPDRPNKVGYLYLGDHSSEINQGTLLYVKNALEFYKKEQPAFIILELDTPGGQLYAAQKIAALLKEIDTQYNIPVVALVNNWAISAGALLAYSCRYIAITKDASMGAAEPITSSGESTSEKVHSAIRADFANAASFYERNPLLAEAMVDADLILVLRDDKIMSLGKEDEILKSDQVILRKGKLLTLNAKQMEELGVADLSLAPVKLPLITEEEKATGKWPGEKNLLFTAPFFKAIPEPTLISYSMDWKNRFFSFLSSSAVTSLLVLIVMITAYVEFNHPTLGFAALVGLAALALLLLGTFAVHAIGYLEIILLVAGIILLLLEIFVIPGFGITGILGILLTLGGLIGLLLPGIRDFDFDFATHTLNAAGHYILERAAWMAGALLLGLIVIAILSRYLTPKLALFSPLVLHGEQEKEKGYVSGLLAENLPKPGCSGMAHSTLRLAGKVEIEGAIYDAMSSNKFIDKGKKIVVVRIDGSKLIVEEVKE